MQNPIYQAPAGKHVVCIGCNVEGLTILQMAWRGNALVANGTITINDFEQAPDYRHMPCSWRADSLVDHGTLTTWAIRRHGGAPFGGSTVRDGVIAYIAEQLTAYATNHAITSETGGTPAHAIVSAPPAPKPAAESELFPADWYTWHQVPLDAIPLPEAPTDSTHHVLPIVTRKVSQRWNAVPEPPMPKISPARRNCAFPLLEIRADECVCDGLENSNSREPFAALHLLVECGCGARWWKNNCEEHFWVKVTDPEAWRILKRTGGLPTVALAYLEGELHLAETLKDRGLSGIAHAIG